jgi:small-conductance mechanosensitive channel
MSSGSAAAPGVTKAVMLEAIRTGLLEMRALLDWAPDWLVAVAILLVAAILSLSLHRLVVRLLRRFLAERHPYIRSFLTATTGLTRTALLVVALFIVLPATPLDAPARTVVAQCLLLVSVILIGWGLITAVDMTADIYLRRFRLDVADNLLARKHLTQIRLLTRTVNTLLIIATIGAALMTFDSVRQYGVSLFASAGVAGLVAGLAARPVLSNLFAGIQIAMTQPIRLDDGVVVEGEFGQIEEITSTYVVVRLWDLRRMIVPLTHFIEKPFQNWTRELGNQFGAVLLAVDYTTPVERVRAKALEIIAASSLWDGQVAKLQVTNASDTTMELRILVSAKSADVFDLRCQVREQLIAFLQQELPDALPRVRQQTVGRSDQPGASAP